MSLNIILKWNIQKISIKETVAYKKTLVDLALRIMLWKLLKSNFYFCSDRIVQMNSSNKWLLMEFDHPFTFQLDQNGVLSCSCLSYYDEGITCQHIQKSYCYSTHMKQRSITLISSMYTAYLVLLCFSWQISIL